MKSRRARNDLILALCILASAALFFGFFRFFSRNGQVAVIEHNGQIIAQLPMDQDESYTFTSSKGLNRIKAGGGFVWMEEADCPDGLCLKEGKISSTSQRIVCLPHRIVVRVENVSDNLDGIVQ